MEFIFTQAFWLLPLASLPIIFNIFNNKKYKTVEFGTIRFIESLKSDSIKKINLLNLLLLILRVLIILFLIMAISRPIMNSKTNGFSENGSSSRLVILIDDSHSNLNTKIFNKQSPKILSFIEQIVSDYGEAATLDVACINQGLIYSGEVKDFSLNRFNLLPTYKDGNMWNLMDKYFSSESKNFLNKDMYIITDMDKTSFDGIGKNHSWNIAFINIALNQKVPSIIDVKISREIIFPNQEFDVSVTVFNNSDLDYNEEDDLLTAYLHIGENISIPQTFNILSKSKKNIIFSGLSSTESMLISATIGSDVNNENQFFTKANISPPINLGLLDIKDKETEMYISKAAKSIKKNRIVINQTMLNYLDLFNYDVIIADDLYILKNRDIKRYINQGGHVVVFQNSVNLKDGFNLNNQYSIDFKKQNQNYFVEKDDILDLKSKKEIFQGISQNILFEINNFISFPLNSNSIIEYDNRSIWNRYMVEKGVVDCIGFSLNSSNTNFSVQASFIPFVYKLITMNKGKQSYIDITNNMIDPIYQPKELFPLLLKNDSVIIDIVEFYTNKIDISNIDRPGYYELWSENNKYEPIKSYIANIDSLELNYNKLKFEMIDSLFNENVYEHKFKEDDLNKLKNIFSRSARGMEIWHIFLISAIILLIIESLIVSIYQRRF